MRMIDCAFATIDGELKLIKIRGKITASQIHKLHKQINLISARLGKFNGKFKTAKQYRTKLRNLRDELSQMTKHFFKDVS